MKKLKLTWYGRCCFLIEVNDKKILIDPHDQFDGVSMGVVDADYTLISSVAHDHGNIAASPHSQTYHEVGPQSLKNDIKITGIMTKEYRGTNNLIYNIKTDNLSITNFADLGDLKSLENLSQEEREILESTDIAFLRPNKISDDTEATSGDLALKTCEPQIIIPHHFYPKKFIDKEGELKKMSPYLKWTENMVEKLAYKRQQIDSYSTEIDLDEFKEKTAILFSDIHPQVSYKN